MLEISKMLTISTAHVTEDTILKLQKETVINDLWLTVYQKAEYGFWIFCNKESIDECNNENIPEDLLCCIRLAQKNDCEWLCLDCDGPIVDELDVLEW